MLFDVRTKQVVVAKGCRGGGGGDSGRSWCQLYDLAIYLAIIDNFKKIFFINIFDTTYRGWRGGQRVKKNLFSSSSDPSAIIALPFKSFRQSLLLSNHAQIVGFVNVVRLIGQN